MKNLLLPLLLCLGLTFCTQTPNITTNPDDASTTSGTVGSAKATNELPRSRRDTARTIDTFKMKLDSALPYTR